MVHGSIQQCNNIQVKGIAKISKSQVQTVHKIMQNNNNNNKQISTSRIYQDNLELLIQIRHKYIMVTIKIINTDNSD